jgi:hypothetical protein
MAIEQAKITRATLEAQTVQRDQLERSLENAQATQEAGKR